MASLWGFEFSRRNNKNQITTKDSPTESDAKSFVNQQTDDGALEVSAAGSFGTYLDLDGTVRTEAELVTKYRLMSLQPECDSAVDEIINESISIDEETIVNINLDNIKVSDVVKKAIREEFQNCLKLIEFNKYAYDIYRRWYIDGRLYYHVIIDDKHPREGIKELRFIDPRKIKKVREVSKKRIKDSTNAADVTLTRTVNEYFVYNDKGFNVSNKPNYGSSGGSATAGLKVTKDSIIHIVSGLTDDNGSVVLSYLHKSIKALNQLRTLEDALVIYRLARAPERRIWYIDVGNLPKIKAEQYVRDIMVKHKNRLVYDASTGEVRDDRKFQTMLEDYWLPRREGGRGTEVTTLPGGQTLGQMDDVLYFQKKFLQCLNVPVSRLNSDALFSVGRATEITRDELKFARFVMRLRSRFSMLFLKMLEKQLILKGIITIEEWNTFINDIKFDFSKDNYFTELKDAEIKEARINLARNFQDMTGKYYSHKWLRKYVLQQTDEDLEEMDEQIAEEVQSNDPRWFNPMISQNQQLQQHEEQEQQMHQPSEGGNEQRQSGSADAQSSSTPHDELQDKIEQIRQAQIVIDQMKAKKGNRSIQDESKYKAAVQIVAKNKHILAQIGVSSFNKE